MLSLLPALSGCPDPCAFLGHGCNVNDDCGADQVCRLDRSFDAGGCTVVKGTCVSLVAQDDGTGEPDTRRLCGSVDDCRDNECCDPNSNTCVGEVSYDVTRCDKLTCRSCTETSFGPHCSADDDCAADENCADYDFNSLSPGVCRASCQDDTGCPGDERCFSSGSGAGDVCSAPVGTPCPSPGDSADCFGTTCIDVDANENSVDVPYCSAFCSIGGSVGCPSGFSCVSSACRKN